jgi:hypothetical protein
LNTKKSHETKTENENTYQTSPKHFWILILFCDSNFAKVGGTQLIGASNAPNYHNFRSLSRSSLFLDFFSLSSVQFSFCEKKKKKFRIEKFSIKTKNL